MTGRVMLKAHRLLDEGRVTRDEEYPGIFWITSNHGLGHRYRVDTDWNAETKTLTYATCTCPSGLFRSGGDPACSHVGAALIILFNERERAKPWP